MSVLTRDMPPWTLDEALLDRELRAWLDVEPDITDAMEVVAEQFAQALRDAGADAVTLYSRQGTAVVVYAPGRYGSWKIYRDRRPKRKGLRNASTVPHRSLWGAAQHWLDPHDLKTFVDWVGDVSVFGVTRERAINGDNGVCEASQCNGG